MVRPMFGFKVQVQSDESGFREWSVYRWNRETATETPVATGSERGPIEAAQIAARKYIHTVLKAEVTA